MKVSTKKKTKLDKRENRKYGKKPHQYKSLYLIIMFNKVVGNWIIGCHAVKHYLCLLTLFGTLQYM